MNNPISWTDETWNPYVGCSKITAGCKNCYAEVMAKRLKGMGQAPYQTVVDANGWTGKIARNSDRKFNEPLRTRKPTVFFVNSMSDFYHPNMPDEWRDKAFAVMALCPPHTFQIATKRTAECRRYLSNGGVHKRIVNEMHLLGAEIEETWTKAQLLVAYAKSEEEFQRAYNTWPLPNVHQLFSASTQPDLERDPGGIVDFLAAPATQRWLSIEPLLGAIDGLRRHIDYCEHCGYGGIIRDSEGRHSRCERFCGIQGVIVGPESGPKRRLFDDGCNYGALTVEDQVGLWMLRLHNIIDQCNAAGVKVHVKQIPIADNSTVGWRVSTRPDDRCEMMYVGNLGSDLSGRLGEPYDMRCELRFGHRGDCGPLWKFPDDNKKPQPWPEWARRREYTQ